MKVRIKRFDKTIPLPAYKTAGAVCLDLYSREDISINANEIGYIPLNIAIEVPTGYWSLLVPRSSTHKLGIMAANSIGIIDEDFNGDNDELKFVAYNFTSNTVNIEKGTRIAQIMVMKNEKIEIEEVDVLGNSDRGGIGSTNLK